MKARSRPERLTPASVAPDLRRQYLDGVVSELWPEHEVSIERGAAGQSYALVPNGRRPVVMIPRRPRRVAAAVLRNYKASADRSTEVRLRLYSLGARLGFADLLPHRITITPATSAASASSAVNDIGEHLKLVLDRDVALAVYTSPPRANRKTVLQLLTPSGHTFAFVKIGTNDLTRDLVRREADALERLGTAPLVSVEVPQLLYRGQWREFELLVQQAFTGSAKAIMAPRALTESMLEVAGVAGLATHPAASNPYVDGLRRRMESLSSQPYGAQLLCLLQGVIEGSDGTELTLGSWHGDWTPWNMTTDGRKALVWDWERFESGVPLGFDALHHDMQGAMNRGGAEPSAAARGMVNRCAVLIESFGVSPRAAELTARLYLLEIGTRYASDRQADAGSRLGLLETWLLPELHHAARASKP